MGIDLGVIKIDTADGNRIKFEIGNRPKKISGGAKIIQEVTKLLLTTPGNDASRPNDGAGLQNILRRISSRGSIDSARGDIISKIMDVSGQIRQNQVGVELPADETLDRLEVLEVQFDERWIIRVRVHSLTGAMIADFGNILLPEGSELFGE